MERRRNGQETPSPTTCLKELPAVVVLERFPIPVLAVAEDGTIIFANEAFGDMLGYTVEEVKSLSFSQIFETLPADDSPVSAVRAHADLIVELHHQDESTVRARMSKSALLRGNDPVALATFTDLTEQLWAEEL